MAGDLRGLLDPLNAVTVARPKWREVPAETYTPPGTTVDPDPAPVTVPAYTQVYTDPADLPAQVTNDGAVDLGAQLALLQAAVGQIQDQRILTVHASRTFASSLVWQPGHIEDVPLTWTAVPLAPVRGAFARLDVGVAFQGKVSASIVDGSVSDTGATARLTVAPTSTVVVSAGTPLTVHADGLYLYVPPFTG